MFEYTICTNPDEELFYKQCLALEKKLIGFEKEKTLQDVDSSLIQIYHFEGKKIIVRNDMAIGCVYIESEIDLENIFN